MDVKLIQLEDIIRKSKCAICGLLLSVGPLIVVSEDGLKIRCGRCKEIKSKTYARYILYENIAEALTFPCSYGKCKKGIPWGQVEEHEKVCPFRRIYCPMYYQSCNDCIEITDLQSHFTQAHMGNMKLGNINCKLPINNNEIFLLLVDNLKFLVYLLSSTDNYFIVFSLDPLNKFTKYNVQIRSDKDEDIFVSYLNQKIIQFNEKEHCFKCWRKQCTLKYHPYSQAYANEASFDWQTISRKFSNCLVELLDNPKHFIITVDLIADQKRQSSGDLTNTTSCPSQKSEDERKEEDEKREM